MLQMINILQIKEKHYTRRGLISWRLILFLSLSNFLLINNTGAQNKLFTPYFGIGIEHLKNDMIIPYGLQGRTFIFGFSYQHAEQELPKWHYRLEVQQSALHSPWFKTDKLYTHWKAQIAAGRQWHPIKETSMQLNIGAEAAITGEYYNPSAYNKTVSYNPSVYGFYDIGIRNFISFQKKIRKITFLNCFNYHLIGFGHYTKPPYMNLNVSESNYLHYTKPNTISHVFNMLDITNRLGIKFNIRNKVTQVLYSLKYQSQNVFIYRQVYIQNALIFQVIL